MKDPINFFYILNNFSFLNSLDIDAIKAGKVPEIQPQCKLLQYIQASICFCLTSFFQSLLDYIYIY